MSIEMRSGMAPMDPELLCAIHIISHFLDGIEERINMPAGGPFEGTSMAEVELIALRTEILDGLLWAWTQYGKRELFTDVVKVTEPVFQSLYRLLKRSDVGDLKVNVLLDEGEIAEYSRTSAIKKLSGERKKNQKFSQQELWSKIKPGKQLSISIKNDPNFIHELLEARAEIIKEKYVGEHESELFLRKTTQTPPIQIDILSQPIKLREVLYNFENKYLDAFMSSPARILWQDNPLRWEKQCEYFLPLLESMYDQHSDFWVSWYEINGNDHREMGRYRFAETLFALQKRGALAITRYQHFWSRDIRFRVRILKKAVILQMPESEGEVIQYANVFTDFDNKRIWSDENKKKRFNESAQKELWKQLLTNTGKKMQRSELEKYLKPYGGNSTVDLENIFEGLIQKLESISGKSRSDVAEWFVRNKDFISLKPLKKT